MGMSGASLESSCYQVKSGIKTGTLSILISQASCANDNAENTQGGAVIRETV